MASYESGFDPPTRPGESSRGRRLGTYMQSSPGKQENREKDAVHLLDQTAQRRRGGTISPLGPTQQTELPRPGLRDPPPATSTRRDPSPAIPSRPELQSRGTGSSSGSSFGFARSRSKPPSAHQQRPPPQELKGKASRNVLRRKPSGIPPHPRDVPLQVERVGSRSPAKWSRVPPGNRPRIDSSIRAAETSNELYTRTRRAPLDQETPRVIPELDRYRARPVQTAAPHHRTVAELPHKLSTQDLPPPPPPPPPTPLLSGTPIYFSGGSSHHRYSGYSGSGYSASPSTRFSESPGPGAAYSRDTTPTSMSSQSPSVVAPLKPTTPRLRQGSPAVTRPPITRRRGSISGELVEGPPTIDPHGLSSLRESLTSSSSNSTVKGDAMSKDKKQKKRLSPLPPSPPPRKSSQKLKRSRSIDEEDSPSRPSQAPARPVMTSPSEASLSKQRRPSTSAKSPPPRPSRDGAPDLQQQLGNSFAIIQSNLAGVSFSSDRRQSTLPRSTVTLPLQNQLSARPAPLRIPTRTQSPAPVQPSPREHTPAPSGLGIIPDLRPHRIPLHSRSMGTRTPSPSTANQKTRFGLFGRRTKTTPDVPTVDKSVRKGPAAGTGHEGYGRYGFRGRSSSAGPGSRIGDRSTSGASSSQESIAHDPFLLQRMSPVIIAGGGEIIENRNASSELTRSESNTSLLQLGRPSLDSRISSKSSLSHELSRATLWPSALLPKETSQRQSSMALPKNRRPSDSSDDGAGKSSLALRRSVQRLDASNLNLTRPPLQIEGMGVSDSITSLDASISSADPRVDASRGRDKTVKKPKKLEKRPKSPRKWNFFHRKESAKHAPEPALQVTVGKPAAARSVPHYAMLDSSDEQQDVGVGDLEDILRDADVVDLSNAELDALQFGEQTESRRRMEELSTAMAPSLAEAVPSPVIFSSPEPIIYMPELLQTELHVEKTRAPIRPSRLPQVGRIPKVISARPEATSPKSFSRPFARVSLSQPPPNFQSIDRQSVALGASPPKSTYPELAELLLYKDPSPRQSADSKSSTTAASHQDFLAFSPRKNSECTTSSSGGMSFAGTTAVIPEPDAELVADEVWDEYDELMENDDDTAKVPTSATSSHGVPFQYESYESRRMRRSNVQQAKESPTLKSVTRVESMKQRRSSEQLPERKSAMTSSSIYSVDMSARLKEALSTVPSPTTPVSFTDFFAGYGERNTGMSAQKPGHTLQSSSKRSTGSSNHSKPRSITSRTSAESTQSPLSQVNLRVGSMTVSKWLTFGHVLFSPAREQLLEEPPNSTKTHSILVIDGLGNDDWSFYAAETYPSSTFYNLSPTPTPSPNSPLSASIATPPNHHQVQHASLDKKFPFPSSTFHVVVYRFPAAQSEASYSRVISECKRVLKPGGWLEMAILDLDMRDMGPRARRGVRALKTKLSQSPSSIMRTVSGNKEEGGIWIGSAGDLVLRLIGKKGFRDIKSCNVGVPVASPVPETDAKSDGKGKGKREEERSLADMMRDPSANADEGITKMVAKVGRWWYTKCYEEAATSKAEKEMGRGRNQSLFNDAEEAVLRECKEWNASFKLVVAYAQKPGQPSRRRTNSV